VDRNAKPIFTPAEVEKLLKTCLTHSFRQDKGKGDWRPDADILGYICPILFNGLRPQEAARIQPDNVRWNEGKAIIDLSSGKQTKLRLRRLVDLNHTCLYWMTLPAPGYFGPVNIRIATNNLKKRMARVIKASGLKWGHDVLRHSFCSYGMQKFGAKETAKLSNHSEDVLYHDYREVVSNADAEAFWNLRFSPASPKPE
jgi:integrase